MADVRTQINEFEAFVSRTAPKIHWKILEATGLHKGLHSGVVDGWRYGFGDSSFGPARLEAVLETMSDFITAHTKN